MSLRRTTGSTSAPPAPGPDLEIGPFRLANRIAVGGMAEVFRAIKPQSAGADRAVVIKRMLPELLEEPSCRVMFEREAILGQWIRHPNVVEVIGAGEHDGAPYLALEYVFGVDLWRLNRYLVGRGEQLPREVAIFLVCELLDGLDAVHRVKDPEGRELEVSHRDVSPSNIFLSVHGDVKLGDLGIARAALRESHLLGPPAGERAKGKLGYLAPEQVAGPESDQRADLFSAGVVAAELLMGRPLFAGGTEIGILLAIRDGDVHAFEAEARSLPDGLREAVLRALARSPEERTPSAFEFRDSLLPFAEGEPAELREALGVLVRRVLEHEEAVEAAFDRQSLAATVETSAEMVFRSMGATQEVALRLASRASLVDVTPADLEEVVEYQLRSGGTEFGPWPYARVVRALLSGEIPPDSLVRTGEGPFQKVSRVPELARHLPPSSRTPTLLRTRMAQTAQIYDLGGRGITEALCSFLLHRDSGLLLCERAGVRKEVYIVLGAPGFVTSNQPGELLGESLVAAEVIERDELDLALALMPRYEGRLGDTLTALGMVEPVQLFRHIEKQVRDKLLDIFSWNSGTGSFYPDVERPEREFPLHLDPWEILDTGLAIREEAGLVRDGFEGRAQAVLVAVPHAHRPASLSEGAGLMLQALAAPRSPRELESMFPEPAQARRITRVLLTLGLVTWRT